MKKILSFFTLALAFGATSASADPLMKYDYFDVAYQWTHVDQKDVQDTNGLDSKLSYSPLENFALEGGYNYARGDIFSHGFNYNEFTYGVLGYYEICPGMHVLGEPLQGRRNLSKPNGEETGRRTARHGLEGQPMEMSQRVRSRKPHNPPAEAPPRPPGLPTR